MSRWGPSLQPLAQPTFDGPTVAQKAEQRYHLDASVRSHRVHQNPIAASVEEGDEPVEALELIERQSASDYALGLCLQTTDRQHALLVRNK